DVTSQWRHRARPAGRYSSTVWIPGNFLAAGRLTVDVAVSSHVPFAVVHMYKSGALSFTIADHFDGDAVRGDYIGEYPGVIRPMLEWATEHAASRGASHRGGLHAIG
ncbi:MAG TPA: hypothetical protein VE861_06635, partial [Gemmatimonadaceae bacterium]|nr:hypothetical protein [Gemmatimonadaceae bacterium]